MPELSETVRVRVRFSEVDALQIVWHGNYVRYLEDAREAFGRRYGLEYMHIFESGYFAPMFDMQMRYHHTATVDDELLVKITYRPARGARVVFDYEVTREKDGLLILTASSTQLFTTREGEFEPSCPPFYEEWKRRNGIVL